MNNELGVVATGTPDFKNYEQLKNIMDKMLSRFKSEEITLITSDEKGTDQMVQRYANESGMKLIIIKTNWEKFGKSAGFKRNGIMYKELTRFSNKGYMCFWDGTSQNITHNFKIAARNNIQLRIYDYKENKIKKGVTA